MKTKHNWLLVLSVICFGLSIVCFTTKPKQYSITLHQDTIVIRKHYIHITEPTICDTMVKDSII